MDIGEFSFEGLGLSPQRAFGIRRAFTIGILIQQFGQVAPFHPFGGYTEPFLIGLVGKAVALIAIPVGDHRRHAVQHVPQIAQGDVQFCRACGDTVFHVLQQGANL